MTPFQAVTGAAVPLMRDNIDTDVIIRIERLAGLPRDQLGAYALEAMRLRADGTEDPDCALNWPQFRGAPILLAGANFGCGSSREAAVWALMGMGIRCVIAPSFGDIFHANCFQNGLLPVRLAPAEIELLAKASGQGEPLTVDLERCTVVPPDGEAVAFALDPARRQGLLEGLDDVELTLRLQDELTEWQRADRIRRPWAWPNPPLAARGAGYP